MDMTTFFGGSHLATPAGTVVERWERLDCIFPHFSHARGKRPPGAQKIN